ncbi:MAG: hypothetical protein IJW40_10025 [Clostridia bacterium]|nr:hypothetical protein [Clostridia bacterium]
MRTRYYSPDMRRFINADVVAGSISNAITLNRFAYANGNPVSMSDPFGLSAIDTIYNATNIGINLFENCWETVKEISSAIYNNAGQAAETFKNGNIFDWGIDKFKELTREDKSDNSIDFFLGATSDNNGIYHIDQNYWQSFPIVRYNDIYEIAFAFGVGMAGYTVDKRKFDFTHQNAHANNLALTVTIDFSSNPDIYAAFKEAWGESAWKFDDMQATYIWRNK